LRILVGAPDATLVDPLESLGSPTPTLTVDADAAFAGDDRELAQRAASANCIVLEGGTWSSWWRLLEPANKRTRLARVVVERHERGANLIGVGAAGTYLCEYSLLSRAELQVPSRDPHDLREHVLVTGLGLVRGACFDCAMDGRTTREPLLEALRSSRVETGVWLSGSCAWIQRGEGLAAHVAGSDGGAFVFDLAAGRRSRESTFGGRVMRLASGQAFDGLMTDTRRGVGDSPKSSAQTAPLDADLGAFPWGKSADSEKSGNSRKAFELRGKRSRLRLYPEPEAGLDVPPPAHTTRPDWIRFDWFKVASSGTGTRIELQVGSSWTRAEGEGSCA
jgi:hypothetical protein